MEGEKEGGRGVFVSTVMYINNEAFYICIYLCKCLCVCMWAGGGGGFTILTFWNG